MTDFLIFAPGVPYAIVAAQRVRAGDTWRLLITFELTPRNMTCVIPPPFTFMLTDREIEIINSTPPK